MQHDGSTYIHCMTGLCRAPLGASILTSILMKEDVRSAWAHIDLLRNVRLDKAVERNGGGWMDKLVTEPCPAHIESNFYMACTTRPASSVVHAGVAGSASHPLCKWRKGGPDAPPREFVARLETPQEAQSFSNTFCQECFFRLSASRRAEVKEVFGRDTG